MTTADCYDLLPENVRAELFERLAEMARARRAAADVAAVTPLEGR